MNAVNSFINQQVGFSKSRNYDFALGRLACKEKEVFTNLFPDDIRQTTVDTPIFACKFAQVEGYKHIVALANEDGKMALYDVKYGGPRCGGEAHKNAIFDLAWMPNTMSLVSVAGDHSAQLYHFRNGDIAIVREFRGHTRSLKTVACHVNDNSVFATGSRDGRIIIWDSRAIRPDIMLCPADICLPFTHHHPSQVRKVRSRNGRIHPVISGSSSVTGLAFQDDHTLLSCGAGDGFIKAWDLRKNYYISDRAAIPKCSIPYSGSTLRNGFSNLILDSNRTKLYANCLDNIIYCYNVATYNPEPIMKYYGHKNSTFYVKSSLSSDDMYLISGSSDDNAYIWDVAYSEPIVKLEGHEAEVTCVAWCPSKETTVLVTCSDDLRHKIWRVGPEFIPKDKKTKYFSWAQMENRKSSHKRIVVGDESQFPYESSEGEDFWPSKPRRNCFGKMYNDEYIMFSTNEELMKKYKRRKYWSPIDLNAPSTSTSEMCFTDESERFKLDYEINTTEEEEEEEEEKKEEKKDKEEEDEDSDSPTSNLPNFMIDGVAPHLNNSPVKKAEKDWLTKLRMVRLSTNDIQESSKPTSSKVQKTDNNKSLQSKNISSTKRPHTSKHENKPQNPTTSRSPLLRYFKFTNSSGQQHTSKSSNTAATSPTPTKLPQSEEK